MITGHGSDENGCGEFCVTSHFLNVDNVTNNITFSTAGKYYSKFDFFTAQKLVFSFSLSFIKGFSYPS